MGFADGPQALVRITSRVIFTNGDLDPWSSQSVRATVEPGSVEAVVIRGGSHHSDLGGGGNPSPSSHDDSPEMSDARRKVTNLVRRWLSVAATERRMLML